MKCGETEWIGGCCRNPSSGQCNPHVHNSIAQWLMMFVFQRGTVVITRACGSELIPSYVFIVYSKLHLVRRSKHRFTLLILFIYFMTLSTMSYIYSVIALHLIIIIFLWNHQARGQLRIEGNCESIDRRSHFWFFDLHQNLLKSCENNFWRCWCKLLTQLWKWLPFRGLVLTKYYIRHLIFFDK